MNKKLKSILFIAVLTGQFLFAERVTLVMPARFDMVNLGFDLLEAMPESLDMACYKGYASILRLEFYNGEEGRWVTIPEADLVTGAAPFDRSSCLILVGQTPIAHSLMERISWPEKSIPVSGRYLHEVVNAVQTIRPLTESQWKKIAANHGFRLKKKRGKSRYAREEERREEEVAIDVMLPEDLEKISEDAPRQPDMTLPPPFTEDGETVQFHILGKVPEEPAEIAEKKAEMPAVSLQEVPSVENFEFTPTSSERGSREVIVSFHSNSVPGHAEVPAKAVPAVPTKVVLPPAKASPAVAPAPVAPAVPTKVVLPPAKASPAVAPAPVAPAVPSKIVLPPAKASPAVAPAPVAPAVPSKIVLPPAKASPAVAPAPVAPAVPSKVVLPPAKTSPVAAPAPVAPAVPSKIVLPPAKASAAVAPAPVAPAVPSKIVLPPAKPSFPAAPVPVAPVVPPKAVRLPAKPSSPAGEAAVSSPIVLSPVEVPPVPAPPVKRIVLRPVEEVAPEVTVPVVPAPVVPSAKKESGSVRLEVPVVDPPAIVLDPVVTK